LLNAFFSADPTAGVTGPPKRLHSCPRSFTLAGLFWAGENGGMNRDIDKISAAVRAKLPAIEIKQHQSKYPGYEDDGVWWFRLPGTKDFVQIDSPDGQCPFLNSSTRNSERV
jgi:hypothetical protein